MQFEFSQNTSRGIAPTLIISPTPVFGRKVPITKNSFRYMYLWKYDFRILDTDFIMGSVTRLQYRQLPHDTIRIKIY